MDSSSRSHPHSLVRGVGGFSRDLNELFNRDELALQHREGLNSFVEGSLVGEGFLDEEGFASDLRFPHDVTEHFVMPSRLPYHPAQYSELENN